jgi:hypothetical protein
MFINTQLSIDSIGYISETIPNGYYSTNDRNSPPTHGEFGILWINIAAYNDEDKQKIVDTLSIIVDKDWYLTTNQELLPLFDSEKYKTGSSLVQPLDLDSEPQTIYYVVKK